MNPREVLEAMMSNDERNIRDTLRCTEELPKLRTLHDCAKRFFEAAKVGESSLCSRTRVNLLAAVRSLYEF
jgi:hypothetical protein